MTPETTKLGLRDAPWICALFAMFVVVPAAVGAVVGLVTYSLGLPFFDAGAMGCLVAVIANIYALTSLATEGL